MKQSGDKVSAVAPTNGSQSITPDELRKFIKIRTMTDSACVFLLAAADAWDEDRKSYEVLRSGIRSLWHGVVDGDMDRLSVGYALKGLFR